MTAIRNEYKKALNKHEEMLSLETKQGVVSVPQLVLCSPPTNTGIQQVRDASGFTQILTKKAFQKLVLVADARFEGLNKGDTVYVTAEAIATSAWSKAVLDLDGTEAILVPVEKIVAFVRA